MAAEARPGDRATFSIVSAVHDVAPYLPEFIESIETQRFDLARVEVIAVDDGSTDGSRAILEAWARRRPGLVTMLAQPNAGQGAARNAGLEHARGEWVTFTDPDDRLDRHALRVAERFARAHREVEVMAARPVLFHEDRGRIADDHARRRQYEGGDRAVDLRAEPNVFPGSATVSFFHVDRVREAGLRFDPRIRPTFEDGHFACRYLLACPAPVVGILRNARYVYRKRAEADSSTATGWAHPGRWGDVLEFGYLAVLEEASRRLGTVPAWLQQVIVYELSWYLREDDRPTTRIRVEAAALPRFHDLMGRVSRHLEPEVVRSHAVATLPAAWVDTLLHGYADGPWRSERAARTKTDPAMRLQRVGYRFTGPAPTEAWSVEGRSVEPAWARTMTRTFVGRAVYRERIAWLPEGRSISLTLDGERVPVGPGWAAVGAPSRVGVLRRWLRLARGLEAGEVARLVLGRIAGALVPPLVTLLGPLIRLGGPTRAAGPTWVLIDRIHDADDNAERLFEYLRKHRPDIDAWFVLERGCADWWRLRQAGERRLVAFGSLRWLSLMLEAEWLLSSHADEPIVRPGILRWMLGRPRWRFGFLQHGVIKDDLSAWLNPKDADLFVVSTSAEASSILADGTGYAYTGREVRLTGLPRFDRLLTVAGRPPEERDLVLIAPTWRSWLMARGTPDRQERDVAADFGGSDYARAWRRLLADPAIRDAAAARGRRVGFMPHPNLQPVLRDLDLPAHVEPLAFEGTDVQALYGRCALLVTDYSSVAFNAAYLDRPVVYYQFDRDLVLGGAHVGRRGYFDYETAGFGPVALDHDTAVAAIVAAIEAGPSPTATFQARIQATFPARDGRCCERVVAAIEELSRPWQAPA